MRDRLAGEGVVLFVRIAMTVGVLVTVMLGVAGILADDLRYLIPMAVVHALMWCVFFAARQRLLGPYRRMVGQLGPRPR